MEPGPSKVAEILAGYLIPSACREEILGDMRERYRSGWGYCLEAAQVIPCAIYSRVCRTTDGVMALMQAGSMYTAFLIAAKCFDAAAISEKYGLARLAIPPVIVLAVMSLADAYSNPRKRWLLKPLFAPTLGFAAAYIEQQMYRQWSLPVSVFAWGSGAGLLLVWTLRLAIPAITDRPQAVNAPAFWRKLELVPLSFSAKSALVPGGILLLVIVYLLIR